MSDIFISYSQKDSEAVNLLIHALRIAAQENSPQEAIDIWIDKTDIPYSADLWDRIQLGIREARSVLVAWSENYLASEITNEELAFALSLGKPIIPVYVSPVTEEGYRKKIEERKANDGHWQRQPTDLADVHHALLRKRLYISYNPDALNETARQILTAAAQNLPYKDGLRKWSNRAYEWILHDQSPRYLLSGADLEDAEAWRDNAAEAQLAIDRGLIDFIAQSRLHQQRRQRRFVIGAGTALFLMAVLLILVIVLLRDTQANLNTANINATRAVANVNALSTVVARTNTTTAETNLPFEALDLLASSENDDTVALLRAAHALRYEPYDPAMDRALQGLIGRVYTYQDYTFSVLGGYSLPIYRSAYLPESVGAPRRAIISGYTAIELVDMTTMQPLWHVEGENIPERWAINLLGDLIGGIDTYPLSKVILLNINTGEILHTLAVPSKLTDIVFSSASNQWITLSCSVPGMPNTGCSTESTQRESQLMFFNAESLAVEASFTYPVYYDRLAVSSDGQYIAAADYHNSTISLIDSTTGREIQTVSGHGDRVLALEFSADASLLASSSGDMTIQVWDVEQQVPYRVFQANSLQSDIAFFPDGTRLASIDVRGRNLTTWDIFTGERILAPNDNFLSGLVLNEAAIAVSDDGAHILSVTCEQEHFELNQFCASNGVREWMLPGARNPYRWEVKFGYAGITAFALSPDETTALVGGCRTGIGSRCETGAIVIFDTTQNVEQNLIQIEGQPFQVGVFPDSQRAFVVSRDGQVSLLDMNNESIIATYPPPDLFNTFSLSAVLSPDTQSLLVEFPSRIGLLDFNTGTWAVPDIDDSGVQAAFSFDASSILIENGLGWLYRWDRTLQTVTESRPPAQELELYGFSSDIQEFPDGRWIAYTNTVMNVLQILDARTLNIIDQVDSSGNVVRVASDGRSLTLISPPDTLQRWAISEAGRLTLISERAIWLPNLLSSYTWTVSPDGVSVHNGDEAGFVNRWDTDYRVFLEYVCSRIGRDFDPEERTRYGIDDRPTCPSG